jgi:hypothetical protein
MYDIIHDYYFKMSTIIFSAPEPSGGPIAGATVGNTIYPQQVT